MNLSENPHGVKIEKAKMKLGEIRVEPGIRVRKRRTIYHIRDLIRVLENGEKFNDPLVVEKNTKMILGGEHRYEAYGRFYGDAWEGETVDVLLADLPSYDGNESIWEWFMLADNDHTVLKMSKEDRNMLLARIARREKKPFGDAVLNTVRLLNQTDESWREFVKLYKERLTRPNGEARFSKGAVTDDISGGGMSRGGTAPMMAAIANLRNELAASRNRRLLGKEKTALLELQDRITKRLAE